MSKLVIANWKANPTTLEDAKTLFEAEAQAASQHPNVTTVIMPPFVFIEELHSLIPHPTDPTPCIGAQDISPEPSGAHTGEVSADMLKGFGVQYVLVGHSERRALGESDEMINQKLRIALDADITPVFLVGEEEKNEAIAQDVLVDQLSRGLEGIAKEQVLKIRFVYEPVWAISTHSNNVAVTPDDAITAITYMRSVVAKLYDLQDQELAPFLYGGSINPSNAQALFEHEEIGGGVVGSASLKPEEFAHVIQIADAIH